MRFSSSSSSSNSPVLCQRPFLLSLLLTLLMASSPARASSLSVPPSAATAAAVAPLTVLGFGSLLSEESARGTFPRLRNFRYGRVAGWRRVLRHPAAIFFERGIADLATLQMSSLSAEPCAGQSFVACAFDVDRPTEEEMEAFRRREEEFELVDAPFAELDTGVVGSGLLCAASTDAAFVERWGQEAFDARYARAGVPTIWGYGPDSGIRPCPTYLRHCVLATSKEGVDPRARDSFLDETFLADRVTTVRQYLASERGSHVMDAVPPPSLVGRYSG